MAGLFISDRICETTTTTGTGAVTLAGAVAGFAPFSYALANGNFCYYLIEGVDSNGVPTGEWETGIGTYTSAGTSLARTTILDSSNSASVVTLSAGTKRVHLTAPAQLLGHRGVTVKKSADLTAQNLTTAAAMTWNTDDIASGLIVWHSTSTNPSRMTAPGFLPHVKLSGQVGFANVTASETITLSIRVGGTTVIGQTTNASPSTSPVYQVESKIYIPNSGDYFELFVQVGADTSVDILAATSWFQLEQLQ